LFNWNGHVTVVLRAKKTSRAVGGFEKK